MAQHQNVKILLLAAFIVGVMINLLDVRNNSARLLEEDEMDTVTSRPVMHTFYHPIAFHGDDNLIRSWEMLWQDAGFDTRVLTLDDAKKHPDFERVQKIVEEKVGTGINDIYNHVCFYRWLAMAAAGGGWMSDNDVFPLDFPSEDKKELPNDGKFTSFQIFVPCLLSGSKDEWERVSKLLIDTVESVPMDFVTDMFIFKEIMEQRSHDIVWVWPDNIPKLRRGYDYIEPHKINCEAIKDSRAVHLSHSRSASAFGDGLYPIEIEDYKHLNRGEAVKVYIKEWKEQCKSSSTDDVIAVEE